MRSLAIVLVASVVSASSSFAAVREMKAVRTDVPPKIDGVLDDPCWRKAVPTSDFVQMDPDEGKLATEQTIVRVLYDDDNLYFGIECLDSRPDNIVSRLVPRDSNFWPGDLVEIVLDTFHDHQNCYGFQVNPKGVQRDYRSEADGIRGWGGIDLAWDGLWYSAGRITRNGWTVEIAIPFKTLRFPRKGGEQVWGINVHRYQSSKREDSNWSFISRDDRACIKVSKAGHLVGLKDVAPGLHIKLLPYGTLRKEGGWEEDAGLSLKYGITSDFTFDATLNPDFCHVEADEERINLTRFELFYEEKRPFFLERKELFTPLHLFYSRRIRDPKFGAKLTGKAGGWSIGVLGAVDDEEGPDPIYGVFRLQKDILGRSSVGIIGVAKQKTKDTWSRALGMDLRLMLGRNGLEFDLAKSFNPGVEGKDWQVLLQLLHFTDRFSIYGVYRDIKPEFNVDQIGFIPHDPHVGEKNFQAGFDYRFYVNRFGIWRVNVRQSASCEKRTDDKRWGWNWENFGVHIDQRNNNALDLSHSDWYFRWMGKGYRGQTYQGRYYIAGMGLIREARIGFRIEDHYDWQDGYFGKIRMVYVSADTRPRENLGLDINGQMVWEYFPSGKLDEVKKVLNLRFTYLPMRNIFLRAFLPMNISGKQYSLNALFSWEYSPMSRFYIAYNERRGKDMKLLDRVVVTKVAYLWSL